MLTLPQRQLYELTSSSPSVLSPTSTSLSPRTTVVLRNLDGEGREWALQGTSVTKVLVDGCSNLTLRINTPLLTSTLEVFNSTNLRIYLGNQGQQPVAATVLLDPPLANVELIVPFDETSPTFIASSTIPPSSTSSPEEAWKGTTLRASRGDADDDTGADDVVLAISPPPTGGPEQHTFQLERTEEGSWGWRVKGLQREEAGGEGDGYPILR